MMPPQSMPIGFTYDGEPLYAAAPAAAGGRQPLAVRADGEPIWPAPGHLVPAGQPQPFGVLSSGAFVWAVEQRPPDPPAPWYRRKLLLVPAAGLAALLAVGVVAAGSSGDEVQQAEQQAAPQAAEERTAAEAEAEPAPPGVDFVMPDFTGESLQVAQNTVQELGVFFSVSHDVRGMRSQVLDSNWQVCSQTPAPGARVQGESADWEGKIDFGVVKLTESCP